MKRAFFGEQALVGSLGKNSCPEQFSFVTQIYVTMEATLNILRKHNLPLKPQLP